VFMAPTFTQTRSKRNHSEPPVRAVIETVQTAGIETIDEGHLLRGHVGSYGKGRRSARRGDFDVARRWPSLCFLSLSLSTNHRCILLPLPPALSSAQR
jgi:hypothetical protein